MSTYACLPPRLLTTTISTQGFQKKKCSCFSSSNILRPVNIGDFFEFWCHFAANVQRLCRWGPYDMKTLVWLWRKSHYNSSHFGTKQQFRSNKNPLGSRLPKCLLVSVLYYTTSGRPSLLVTPRCERKSKIVQINGRKESVYCDSKKERLLAVCRSLVVLAQRTIFHPLHCSLIESVIYQPLH